MTDAAEHLPDVVGRTLTDTQEKLIEAICSGVDSADIPDVVAGYGNAANRAKAMRSEAVQAELKARRAAQIKGTLAHKALKAMEYLVTNEKTPAATRFSAAKWVLEQAGHITGQDDQADKPLAEMSEAELAAFMRKAERTIAEGGKAPLIRVTPDDGA